ncbi:alginate export family protein [Leptospira sp. 96542]|nr:alginate export family protein [Leptospira sp. 96542]
MNPNKQKSFYPTAFVISLILIFFPSLFAQEKDPNAKEVTKYISPMKEKGLDPEFNRHMFVEPELAKKSATNPEFWLNDVLRFGLYLRPRQEFRYNLDFNASDKAYVDRTIQTSTIYLLFDPNPYVQAKISLQDARVWGGGTPANTGDLRANFFNNTPDLYVRNQTNSVSLNQTGIREAFFIINKLPLGAKIQIGRQIWAYGDQRMIGGGNWTINGLSYDGARLMFGGENYKIHFLFSRPVWTQSGTNGVVSANDPKLNSASTATDTTLLGTYNSFTIPNWVTVDLYSLGILRKWKKNTTNPISGLPNDSIDDPLATTRSRQNQNLITTGFRITNRTKSNFLPDGKQFDFTWESAFQSGTSGIRINEYYQSRYFEPPYDDFVTERQRYVGQMHVFQTGYSFFHKLRLGVQVLYASGDKNRADGSVSTFQTLANPRFGVIPYFNSVAGISENINAQNLLSKSVSLTYKSNSWGEFQITYFQNDKAEKQDAWYAISGAANSTNTIGVENSSPVSADKGSTENYSNNGYTQPYSLGKRIYNEVDLTWMGHFYDNLSLWLGVGYLSAGEAVKNYRNTLLVFDSGSNQFVWNQNALLGKNQLAKQAGMAYVQINASF